jgi:RNA polymerase sigma-70 factor, ECF subfamily
MRVSGLEEGFLAVPALRGVVPAGGDPVMEEARAEELRLIGAARGGDRGAFGALYALYGRLVHGIVLARVPRTDVEDLVQDVFVQAMQRLGSLRDPRAFGGWLAVIARNLATDHLRRTPRLADMPQDLAASPDDQTQALAVLAIIRRLPEAYRETLVLRLVEGMTGPEIAARTGLTPASVRVNLHRGMKQLRERLEGSAPRG